MGFFAASPAKVLLILTDITRYFLYLLPGRFCWYFCWYFNCLRFTVYWTRLALSLLHPGHVFLWIEICAYFTSCGLPTCHVASNASTSFVLILLSCRTFSICWWACGFLIQIQVSQAGLLLSNVTTLGFPYQFSLNVMNFENNDVDRAYLHSLRKQGPIGSKQRLTLLPHLIWLLVMDLTTNIFQYSDCWLKVLNFTLFNASISSGHT